MSTSNTFATVPHLTTGLTGPLQELEQHLLQHQPHIERWLRREWQRSPAPFYASVDLRNAGFKLAPVDTNLFPAGFNNLNPAFLPLCVQAVQSAIENFNPDACKLLLVPENHTRNLFYLESLATLCNILHKAGYEVRLGSLQADLDAAQTLVTASGHRLVIEPIIRHGRRVGLQDFDPCLILLNNDLSSGRPALLEDIEQELIPPLALGWSNRLKTHHFGYYQQVAEEFAAEINIDPWLINPLFKNCGEINFMKRAGEDCLARNADELLAAIQKKYDAYGVDQRPFVIVKANAGTYGMGVMTVHSGAEIYNLNRKQRSHMTAGKGGVKVSDVIIQEGVYTFETWGDANAVAEPVVYMIGHFVVGGFYRVHTQRGINENLNAPGMHFEPLAFADSCNTPDENMEPDACPNRFYAYGVIARLALLAAARELASASSTV
jgi:glutamate--cysteine ligase